MKKFNHPFALFKKKLQSKKISEWYEKKNRLIVIILPNKPKTPTETYIINRHTHNHTFKRRKTFMSQFHHHHHMSAIYLSINQIE